MKYVIYFLRLLWHWVATGVYYVARVGALVPGISTFCKSLVASFAAGASSHAIDEKRFFDAAKILKPIEAYEIKDVSVGSAQYNLAYLYFHGHGVEKDEHKAEELLKKAAENGNSEAMKFLRGGARNDPF